MLWHTEPIKSCREEAEENQFHKWILEHTMHKLHLFQCPAHNCTAVLKKDYSTNSATY